MWEASAVASLTRRELVRRSARVAAAAAVLSQTEWLAACGGNGKKGPTEQDWASLEKQLRGRLVRPGGAGYRRLNLPSNTRYADVHAQGIAVVADANDVSTCIQWGRDHEIDVVPRAGGHSYSGYSSTTGLMVDFDDLRKVTVDRATGVVTVEPGARNTNVYDGLQPYGVAFSAGRCPTVAISGLALGGGFGFSSRHIGLTSDALLETEVVTADGKILTCSETQNADLFWACRGGGGRNFGINTSFRLRSWPVGDVSLYDFSWDWKDAREVVAELQKVVREAPDEWSMRIGIGASGKPGSVTNSIGALGQFFGTPSELKSILDPVLTNLPPTKSLLAKRTFWQAKNYLYHTTPDDRYAVKSNYVTKEFPEQAIDVLVRSVERWPGSGNPGGAGIALFAWGGQVSHVAPEATAFVHRDPGFLMAYDTSWAGSDPKSVADSNLEWLDGLAGDIAPYVTRRAYQNFIDGTLKDWQQAYYGQNFDRLRRVKRKYDPDDFFRFQQSIPT
jgi:FAD/FMN-containing dehydrogenase